MDILQSGALVYFIAGVAVGVALTMVVFTVAVALDRARLRRGIRRAKAAASMAAVDTPAVEPAEAALNTVPAPSSAALSPSPAAPLPPESAAPQLEPVAPVSAEPSTPSTPSDRTPTVEELFAEAFRAETSAGTAPPPDRRQ